MKQAKALSALIVPFAVALVEYVLPELPNELVITGSALLGFLLVYFIPNKE